jgi:hypothetical protein
MRINTLSNSDRSRSSSSWSRCGGSSLDWLLRFHSNLLNKSICILLILRDLFKVFLILSSLFYVLTWKYEFLMIVKNQVKLVELKTVNQLA